ncbi:hypothetical protein [Actinomadura madurae]|uniref:hypothetical protein n=1 Tax=Actinomadura madurae TaxID=1993 RepID=UPI0020D20550|nr:hypothetical protein [Actinomadura madurae]MCP9963891.1 hypothetical protein [Actinomadura madurae]MCP9976369.1 hypothetical protein [Actinomadura madurae]MCQ0012562.1 hypothetical protein [Actinomadura madurae]
MNRRQATWLLTRIAFCRAARLRPCRASSSPSRMYSSVRLRASAFGWSTESTKNATVSLTVRSTLLAYSPPSAPAYSGTWSRISRSISSTAAWRCCRRTSGSSAGMGPSVIRCPFDEVQELCRKSASL